MKKITLKQGCILFIAAYIMLAVLFYFIAHDQLTYKNVTEEMSLLYYLLTVLVAGILLGAYLLRLVLLDKKGKTCLGLRIIAAFRKYEFLLSQLVARDFKTKYKRSVLGVLWSFLNPLLTMSVQYIVFSTLFKTSIDNFPVYLLIGIVFFSFFSEAVSMSLMSIISNANLITKVYVPKYIYPVSRVLSSTVNFLLSMIPLLLVVIITKASFTPAFLFLPFSMGCLIIFCLGLGMLLSSAMVYFRDTQFLWNVISMLWMYATPIFYPESIIPDQFMLIYKMNPLYHFIRFTRTIIMQGVSPEPVAYLYCLIFAFGMLAIGATVFKKTQNGFVLHI